MKIKTLYVGVVALLICCSCCQKSNLSIILPKSAVEIYNTLKPDNNYKRKSVAFSKANAYGMNRMAYRKCTSDSLRTDICYIFTYVGTEKEIEQIKADLSSTPKMYDTVIYWDKKGEFAEQNKNIFSPGIAFIAYLTDMQNRIIRIANPTIVDFSSVSLDRLQNNWNYED